MANVKNAGVREIILDRYLRKRRGYTINELMELVNKHLVLEGFRPITAGNTIRNDLTYISNRWKQPIRESKRRQAICYCYEDPSFSIFKCEFTLAEKQFIHSLLINCKFMDILQGSPLCQELEEHLREELYPDSYEQPILIFENIPNETAEYYFSVCYDSIRSRQPILVVHARNKGKPASTIHPYFLRQHRQKWHLLGYDDQQDVVTCICVNDILSIEKDYDAAFIPRSADDVNDYYDALFENNGKKK